MCDGALIVIVPAIFSKIFGSNNGMRLFGITHITLAFILLVQYSMTSSDMSRSENKVLFYVFGTISFLAIYILCQMTEDQSEFNRKLTDNYWEEETIVNNII